MSIRLVVDNTAGSRKIPTEVVDGWGMTVDGDGSKVSPTSDVVPRGKVEPEYGFFDWLSEVAQWFCLTIGALCFLIWLF